MSTDSEDRNLELYTEILDGLIIGNAVAAENLLKNREMGIVRPPLTDTTVIVNLCTFEISGKIPSDVIYLQYAQSQYEPIDASFAQVNKSMMEVVNNVLRIMIRNGHVALVVCETGRRQSAMVAVLYKMISGGNAQTIWDEIEYAYMTKSQRQRHTDLRRVINAHRHDMTVGTDDDAAAAAAAKERKTAFDQSDLFTLTGDDKAFFEKMQQTRICLSPQYKKLLMYHISLREGSR